MPKQGAFSLSDIVLAEDKGRLYEAKIMKTKNCNSNWKYFIHYQGWSGQNSDVWCDEEKLVKLDPTQPKPSRLGIILKNESDSSDTALTTAEDVVEIKKRKAAMTEEEVSRKKKLKQLMQNEIFDDERDMSG